jgi:hypothetical protein
MNHNICRYVFIKSDRTALPVNMNSPSTDNQHITPQHNTTIPQYHKTIIPTFIMSHNIGWSTSFLNWAAGNDRPRTSSPSSRRQDADARAQFRAEKQRKKESIERKWLRLQRDAPILSTEEFRRRRREFESAERKYLRTFRSFEAWRRQRSEERRASEQVHVQEVVRGVGDPVTRSTAAGQSNTASLRDLVTGLEILPGA